MVVKSLVGTSVSPIRMVEFCSGSGLGLDFLLMQCKRGQ